MPRPRATPHMLLIASSHVIERTSPKGEQFKGKCMMCDAVDLDHVDTFKYCPNPNRITVGDALMLAIQGKK